MGMGIKKLATEVIAERGIKKLATEVFFEKDLANLAGRVNAASQSVLDLFAVQELGDGSCVYDVEPTQFAATITCPT